MENVDVTIEEKVINIEAKEKVVNVTVDGGRGPAGTPAPVSLNKLYKTLLTQSGGDAPVPTILENSFGGPGSVDIQRIKTGIYQFSNNDFIVGKTLVTITIGGFDQRSHVVSNHTQNRIIEISTYNSSNALADGILVNASLIIEKYP